MGIFRREKGPYENIRMKNWTGTSSSKRNGKATPRSRLTQAEHIAEKAENILTAAYIKRSVSMILTTCSK